MNIKRFRLVCNISSYVLKGMAVLTFVIISIGLFQILIGNSNVSFTYEGPSFSIFSSGGGGALYENQNIEAKKKLVASIIAPIFVIVYAFILWQGGNLFKRLANGETPFNTKFAKSLKQLSLLLIASDIAFPMLYSLILSAIIENGHYVQLGLTSLFVIGILLYVISEIFFYGIELQHLADETV